MRSEKSKVGLMREVQRRDNFMCRYCGKDGLASLDNWHDCTIDHVVPRTHGGSDDETNLVTCCGYCNAIKSERVFESIDAARAYIMERRKKLQGHYEKVLDKVFAEV